MVRFEHLPIYRKAMEFAIYLEDAVKNFSRYNKYSTGAELRELWGASGRFVTQRYVNEIYRIKKRICT